METIIDLDEIIVNIFSYEPKSPKSINLSFDVKEEYDLFKMLVHILTEGLKILYGDPNGNVNLDNLEGGDTLYKYFASFGFIINFNVNNVLNPDNIDVNSVLNPDNIDVNSVLNPDNIENEEEKKVKKNTELHLYYFTLKTEKFKYEITFDYL